MNNLTRCISLALFLLISSNVLMGQFYNGSQQEFGKNRVQYRDFHWIYYPGDDFEVYYYQGGRDLAAYTLRIAESCHQEISKVLDYPLSEKVQIIVYNKQSEFRQSNVGLSNDDQYNIGGATRIIGSKMFIYYEGSHQQLEKQIKENLTRVIFNQMMYGGDWKDIIKNSTLLAVPDWFEKGIISYANDTWNPEVERHIRNGVSSGSYQKFNQLSEEDAKFAGHALWKYIADVYGENVIPNILYMTRISKNVESGFLFVLGVSLDNLSEDFIDYYENYFDGIARGKSMPVKKILNSEDWRQNKVEKYARKGLGELPLKYKSKYTYSQFKTSPDGKYIAYTTNEMGQYKIWIHEFLTGKNKRIFKGEYRLQRIVDNTFPILTWHPTGEVLAFTFEKKGRAFIGNYFMDSKKVEKKELFRIDKVIDFDYSDDGRKMIFSGVNNGQTDLYLYQIIGNNQQRLTHDMYDDLNPRFVKNSSAVIFASNRPDDTLRTIKSDQLFNLNTDIFVMNLNNPKILERVTNTPQVNEMMPSDYDGKNYTFLSDEAGILNRYVGYIDSTISRVDTTIHYRKFTVSNIISNFAYSPSEYYFNPEIGKYTLVFLDDNRPQVFIGDATSDEKQTAYSMGGLLGSNSAITEENADSFMIPKNPSAKKGEIDINDYRFVDDARDYEYEKQTIRLDEFDDKGVVRKELTDSLHVSPLPKTKNYRINFATDYVLSQVDNSFANQFYQTFSGPNNTFPGLSGLMKLGASDLFEDYKIVGGFRLSGTLENNDYGLVYQNLKERLDKKIILQRQGTRRFSGNSVIQLQIHSAEYEVSWPINELMAIKGSAIYRVDKAVYLSVDATNLRKPSEFTNSAGLKVQFVFDNTIAKGLNLYNGTRFKVWAERYQEPTVEATDFNVLGLDFRHYERIHRDLIFAVRVAGGTSFGNRKLVHYLGGVDNWLFQKVDNSTVISQNANYRYQTTASPLRGFYVNSRNGNSFGVVNGEIRWPVFKYFINKPLKSDFAENFQVVGFADVGSAWTGPHPYHESNEFNIQTVTSGPITVTIDNNRDPIIYGYGFGLRSRVLGYFVRADWAWGIDDGIRLPRVFYLSLNLDF